MSRSLRAWAKKLRTYLGLERREQLARARRPRTRNLLTPEPLEERTLLSSATRLGVPDWVNQGPGPIANGQAEGIQAGAITNPVVGAVTAIAPDPNDAKIIFVGTANGGVWKTTRATNANPTWTPVAFPVLYSASLLTGGPSGAASELAWRRAANNAGVDTTPARREILHREEKVYGAVIDLVING
jgi:hypothetical protein